MNVFEFLEGGYLNSFDQPYPSTPPNLRSNGPNLDVGSLGQVFQFSEGKAVKLSDPAITPTLKGVTLQVVRFLSTSTAANVLGQPVFASDYTNFVVTPDATATSLLVGIPIFANTKGNIGLIAIGGLVQVKFGTISKGGGGAANDNVIWAVSGGVGVGNVLANATPFDGTNEQFIFGKLFEAATTGATKFVKLNAELGFQHSGIRG